MWFTSMRYADNNNLWYPYRSRLHHCCHPYLQTFIQVRSSLDADRSCTIGRHSLDCSLQKPVPAILQRSIKPIWFVIIVVSDFWSDSLMWNKLTFASFFNVYVNVIEKTEKCQICFSSQISSEFNLIESSSFTKVSVIWLQYFLLLPFL